MHKICSFCSEEIKATAIKCRYCGSMLTEFQQPGPDTRAPTTGITLVRQALASRYEIQEEIGRGGMATVYRAMQKNLNRPVSLKVIHQNLVHDSEFVARFHREAQVCASMQHPNIVTVYDEGELGGVHFMAMELLDGHDLHRLIRQQGKLSVEQTLSWLKPIVQALEYAHSRDIIHRDIKSSNMLVSNNGRPVLMDFGIAHAASGTRLTQTGLVIGTPEYMSPEQAEGRQLDHRTDIYSLGIVLYECLTGNVPFKGDSPLTIIMKVVNEAPEEPIQLNRQIPGWLNSVVLKCLAKDREQRFGNAAALYESLTATQLVSVAENKAVEEPPSEQETLLNKGMDKPDEGLPKPPLRKKKSGSGLKVFAWVLFAALLVACGFWAYQYLEEQQAIERENLAYNSALRTNTIESFKNFLNIYPVGPYSEIINGKLEELKLIKYGLTDSRDGQNYKVVKIGEQIWMAENLNIGVKINQFEDFQNNGIIQKRCLRDNCDDIGGLYSWGEAVQYINGAESSKMWNTKPVGHIKGICPDGWHIPNDNEWCTLVKFIDPNANCSIFGVVSLVAGRKLGSKNLTFPNTGKKGTDDYGFNMLYGGYLGPGPIGFDWYTVGARYCTSTKISENKRLWWGRSIWLQNDHINGEQQHGISRYEDHRDLFSVRCIKD